MLCTNVMYSAVFNKLWLGLRNQREKPWLTERTIGLILETPIALCSMTVHFSLVYWCTFILTQVWKGVVYYFLMWREEAIRQKKKKKIWDIRFSFSSLRCFKTGGLVTRGSSRPSRCSRIWWFRLDTILCQHDSGISYSSFLPYFKDRLVFQCFVMTFGSWGSISRMHTLILICSTTLMR